MTITIRQPQAEDWPQWQQLYAQYADFYQVESTVQMRAKVWDWIADPGKPFYCQVAVNRQQHILGLIHYRSMPSPLRATEVGFLDDLFVAPDARRQGVAKALLLALQREAIAQQWPCVRWITAHDNHTAQALYQQLASKTHWLTYQMDPSA
ncbi:GNAT family N-acetyltransferase [Aliagarivorans marinus]|uniref:GNAT family N-acetyltransferase n=1 Tax=Aliagarivorans marinus TaxID=561965 RepID=UPI00042A84D2|nr:GNAT family N-acetyltransferase [Aliagarivorans marinus]